MKWITEITLNNFRAFGTPETIKIPKGNHLLIYGENGSGKSSIYNALKDFFSSSVAGATTFKLNKFEDAKNNNTGNIEITIAEDGVSPTKYKFAHPYTDSNHRIDKIILASKFKGFLDYKLLLKIHAIEFPEDKNPDFFDLIFKNLLAHHRLFDPQGGVTTVELLPEYTRIEKILRERIKPYFYETIPEIEERLIQLERKKESLNKIGMKAAQYQKAQNRIKKIEAEKKLASRYIKKLETLIHFANFKSQLFDSDTGTGLLVNVFKKVNDYLNLYFKNKINADIRFKMDYEDKTQLINSSLEFKIEYAGVELEYYSTFLNEARLSALAISIYLASIKTYDPGEEALKILYLDDVFIGLDTSNRFPLMEIIKKEFIDEGFQIFISTYDREWFELSRHWFQTKLPGKIKALELFIEDDGNPNTPDYPVLIPYDGNLIKAESYFKAKDYPAAGNYLRKECESLVKDLLPDTYKIDGSGSLIEDFEHLLNQFSKFYDDCDITKPTEVTDAIKIYRKALLNPSSHSDSKSPLFKKEIQDAFEIVTKLKALQKITRIQVAAKGAIYTYRNTGAVYTAELELAENIWKVEHGGATTFSKHKFRISKWTWNGVDFKTNAAGDVMSGEALTNFCLQSRTIEKIFEIINHSTTIPIPVNPNAEIRIGGGTLNDLLQ